MNIDFEKQELLPDRRNKWLVDMDNNRKFLRSNKDVIVKRVDRSTMKTITEPSDNGQHVVSSRHVDMPSIAGKEKRMRLT